MIFSAAAAAAAGVSWAATAAAAIVAGEGEEWIHFDYVPGEPDVRLGSAGVIGRLCIIGTGIDKDEIRALFGVWLEEIWNYPFIFSQAF